MTKRIFFLSFLIFFLVFPLFFYGTAQANTDKNKGNDRDNQAFWNKGNHDKFDHDKWWNGDDHHYGDHKDGGSPKCRVTPEPISSALFLLGGGALAVARRVRRNKSL